jgi:hypothetical protein
LQPQPRRREFNDLLLESIDETITILLSREVVDALYRYLQTTHSISRDQIPSRLDALSSILAKTFGLPSSATISKVIARRFYSKLALTFSDNPGGSLLEYVERAKMKVQERDSSL